jgi:hypothetical protein
VIGFLLIVLTEPKRLFGPIQRDTDDDVGPCVPDDLA